MKEENYWKQFCATGKIDDYLSYLRQKQAKETALLPENEGDHLGAGSMQCYRDDIEGGTFRGI